MSGPVPSHMRLARFSLVGAIGIGVQVLVLAMLTAIETNYLIATILAVESAILHNFIWHQHFTWPDRSGVSAKIVTRLLRFQLSNGLISLVGNVLLMRLFRGGVHLPVLPANLVSISICAVLNFLISDRWVFAAGAPTALARYFSIAPASALACVAQRVNK